MTYGFCCVAGCQKSLQWLHSVTGKTSSPQLVFIFPVFITHWGCRFSQGKAFCWAYSAYQLISNVVCSQFCHLCLTVSFWSPLWVTVVTDVVEQFRLTCNISWYFVARLLMKLVSNKFAVFDYSMILLCYTVFYSSLEKLNSCYTKFSPIFPWYILTLALTNVYYKIWMVMAVMVATLDGITHTQARIGCECRRHTWPHM